MCSTFEWDIGNVPKVSDLQSSSRIFNLERTDAGWKLVSRPETCRPDKNMSRHNIYKVYLRIVWNTVFSRVSPASIYFFKINNRYTRKWREICSKLTIIKPDDVLMFLLLTLNILHTFFQCFYCWLWASKCQLGPIWYKIYNEHTEGVHITWKSYKNIFWTFNLGWTPDWLNLLQPVLLV